MNSFWLSLRTLFSTLDGLDPKTHGDYIVVFVAGCAIMGVLIIVLDLCHLQLRGTSVLRLRHGPLNSLLFFITWPLGAAIFGFIGLVFRIFQPSVIGCAAVAFTWLVSFRKLVEEIERPVIEEPEEDSAEGDEP